MPQCQRCKSIFMWYAGKFAKKLFYCNECWDERTKIIKKHNKDCDDRFFKECYRIINGGAV